MNEIKLFRRHVNGIGTWRIHQVGNIIRIAHATAIGGEEVFHEEVVHQGLAGRTLQQQIDSRIRSRVSRLKDKGYKTTLEEAKLSSGNQLGLSRPMLAQPLDRVTNVNYTGSVLQKKLDGHRCLITRQDGDVIAYTRAGKRIDTIGHLIGALAPRLSEGVTIDGELYCHGHPLQTLASWIKREQPSTKNISFVGYDLISDDRYIDRHAEVLSILQGTDTGCPGRLLALPYAPYEGDEHMYSELKRVRAAGFEGLMLRLDNRGYQSGARSTSLIKIKEFHDEEFKVVNIWPSKDGWAICECVTATGKSFRCSAPGDMVAKQAVLINKDKFIGRYLTVEFSHWTNDNIPFHPTALRWREDL